MDPITSVQWLNAGSQVLGSALGGSKSGGPAGPSRADSSASAPFDSSGWIVGTGAAKVEGTTGQALPWPALILGGLVGLLIWKKA